MKKIYKNIDCFVVISEKNGKFYRDVFSDFDSFKTNIGMLVLSGYIIQTYKVRKRVEITCLK